MCITHQSLRNRRGWLANQLIANWAVPVRLRVSLFPTRPSSDSIPQFPCRVAGRASQFRFRVNAYQAGVLDSPICPVSPARPDCRMSSSPARPASAWPRSVAGRSTESMLSRRSDPAAACGMSLRPLLLALGLAGSALKLGLLVLSTRSHNQPSPTNSPVPVFADTVGVWIRSRRVARNPSDLAFRTAIRAGAPRRPRAPGRAVGPRRAGGNHPDHGPLKQAIVSPPRNATPPDPPTVPAPAAPIPTSGASVHWKPANPARQTSPATQNMPAPLPG